MAVKALEAKVLKGEKPLAGRAGDFMPPVDLEAKRQELELTLQYSRGERTNTSVAPYEQTDANYIGLQAQINF